jgi:hypothetical protein
MRGFIECEQAIPRTPIPNTKTKCISLVNDFLQQYPK